MVLRINCSPRGYTKLWKSLASTKPLSSTEWGCRSGPPAKGYFRPALALPAFAMRRIRPRDRRASGGREEANRCVAPKNLPHVRAECSSSDCRAIDRRAPSNDARHRQLGGVQLFETNTTKH